MAKIGFWALIVGLILSVVFGIISPHNTAIIIVLIILGVVIGFLNITSKETLLFLVATVALVVVGNVFAPLTALRIGEILGNILSYVATLMAPAAIIVAVKAIWSAAKPGD